MWINNTLTINSGNVIATSGEATGTSYGIYTSKIDIASGSITMTSGPADFSYGMLADNVNIEGGDVTVMGYTYALQSYSTPTLPDYYLYWTNDSPTDEGATRHDDGAFNNSKELKYVRIAAPTFEITAAPEINPDTHLAVEGEVITFTVTPPEGQVIDAVTVTGTNGTVDHDRSDETYFFSMPGEDVSITATFTALPSPEIRMEAMIAPAYAEPFRRK